MIGTFSQPTSSIQNRSHIHSYPYDVAILEQKSVQSLRVAFTHWIRSLPMEERFVAVKISASKLPKIIRQILSKIEIYSSNRNPQIKLLKQDLPQKKIKGEQHKKLMNKLEKGFWDSIVLISEGNQYLGSICFDFALLECPQKLFDLLIITVENSAYPPLQEALKRRRSAEIISEILINCNSRQQLAFQVIVFLKQQIFVRFRECVIDSQFLTRHLEEQKKLKKQYSMHWKYLNEENRNRLLLLGHNSIELLHTFLKEHDILIGSEQLEKQISDLLKLQKNNFCNRIFKCKLKKTLQPIINYYELVYYEWKQQVEKLRRKKMLKHMRTERDYNSQQKADCREAKLTHGKKPKHQKHRKSTSFESNETNQTQKEKILQKTLHHRYRQVQKNQVKYSKIQQQTKIQYLQITLQKKNHKQLKKETNQIIIESKVTNKEKIIQDTKITHDYMDKNQLYQIKKEAIYRKSEIIENNRDPESKSRKPTSISSSSTKFSLKNLFSQRPYIESIISHSHLIEANHFRLDDQLQDMSDYISEQANQFHQRRVVAFERIQFLLQYYSIPIRLFGSCASGIAVRNSDVDIAIDNSLLSYVTQETEQDKVKAGLEWVVELFKTQACITQIKLIKTAVIPVIKVTINTAYLFLDPSIGQVYYILNRSHYGGPIDADITVQTRNKSDQCSHMGIISTNAINNWLSEISTLHTIVIVIKQFFLNRKLNITYQGGLNGFSMISLLVAYIYHAKLQEEGNAATVLQKILKFYSEEFNEKDYGIDLTNHKKGTSIYYAKGSSENICLQHAPKASNMQSADLQIHDPMQPRKNMTRNCYLFTQIKKLFKQILQKCFETSQQQIFEFSKKETNVTGGKQLWQKLKQSFLKRNVFMQLLESKEVMN